MLETVPGLVSWISACINREHPSGLGRSEGKQFLYQNEECSHEVTPERGWDETRVVYTLSMRDEMRGMADGNGEDRLPTVIVCSRYAIQSRYPRSQGRPLDCRFKDG
jgi:hypothetical protein